MSQDIVVRDTPQNPYKEFTFVIPNAAAGANRVDLFYAMNYLRILSLSLNTLSINFNGSTDTSVVGAGIGIKLPDVIPRVQLINTGGAPITITVAVGIGEFFDNRLTVTGNLNSVVLSGASMPTTADVAVLTVATTQVSALNTARKTVIISNLAANATKIRVGDASTGAARGTEVPIGGTFIADTTAAVFVFNPSGGTINIGVTEIVT